jgi:phospholipid/cholesterol/gamma-HCH transport system substrate-binding protein
VTTAAAEERRNILIGGLVLTALMAITALVYVDSARQKAKSGYPLIARFHKAEGVALGTDVQLAGVVIGKVVAQNLDDRFRAVLTLQVADEVALPADSNAAIQTDGLLGSKFITLQPGGDDKILKPGEEITYTQDSLAVSDLLDMIIAQAQSVHGGSDK